MIIVKYGSQYKNQLEKLFLESRQKTFHWLDTSTFRLNDFEIQTKGERIFVAIEKRAVMGFISIWLEDNFIHHLYVIENYQQKKVGSELLKTAIQLMKGTVLLKCLEKNISAILFYKKNGFIEKEKGGSIEGDFVLMERILV